MILKFLLCIYNSKHACSVMKLVCQCVVANTSMPKPLRLLSRVSVSMEVTMENHYFRAFVVFQNTEEIQRDKSNMYVLPPMLSHRSANKLQWKIQVFGHFFPRFCSCLFKPPCFSTTLRLLMLLGLWVTSAVQVKNSHAVDGKAETESSFKFSRRNVALNRTHSLPETLISQVWVTPVALTKFSWF